MYNPRRKYIHDLQFFSRKKLIYSHKVQFDLDQKFEKLKLISSTISVFVFSNEIVHSSLFINQYNNKIIFHN